MRLVLVDTKTQVHKTVTKIQGQQRVVKTTNHIEWLGDLHMRLDRERWR